MGHIKLGVSEEAVIRLEITAMGINNSKAVEQELQMSGSVDLKSHAFFSHRYPNTSWRSVPFHWPFPYSVKLLWGGLSSYSGKETPYPQILSILIMYVLSNNKNWCFFATWGSERQRAILLLSLSLSLWIGLILGNTGPIFNHLKGAGSESLFCCW